SAAGNLPCGPPFCLPHPGQRLGQHSVPRPLGPAAVVKRDSRSGAGGTDRLHTERGLPRLAPDASHTLAMHPDPSARSRGARFRPYCLLGGALLIVTALSGRPAQETFPGSGRFFSHSGFGGLPQIMLWAWERRENLDFIDPREIGVAFLA